jgi:hypothetical protein
MTGKSAVVGRRFRISDCEFRIENRINRDEGDRRDRDSVNLNIAPKKYPRGFGFGVFLNRSGSYIKGVLWDQFSPFALLGHP